MADVLVALVRAADLRPPLHRPLPFALGAIEQAPTLRGVGVVALLGVLTGELALALERRPPASEARDSAGVVIDLGHVGDHPLEERAIVADDHHRCSLAEHPYLQPIESVEVEVVRRFVEEQHVEPRQ